MPTKIAYKTWSGPGGNETDGSEHITGFCKEDPEQVLEQLHLTHFIYRYKDLLRPIDWNYPNNCSGLILSFISEAELTQLGIERAGSVASLQLDIAKGDALNRTQETFAEAVKQAQEQQIKEGAAPEWKRRLAAQLEEVKRVVLR